MVRSIKLYILFILCILSFTACDEGNYPTSSTMKIQGNDSEMKNPIEKFKKNYLPTFLTKEQTNCNKQTLNYEVVYEKAKKRYDYKVAKMSDMRSQDLFSAFLEGPKRKDFESLEDFIIAVEIYVRQEIPYAANQILDLSENFYAYSYLNLCRILQESSFHFILDADSKDESFNLGESFNLDYSFPPQSDEKLGECYHKAFLAFMVKTGYCGEYGAFTFMVLLASGLEETIRCVASEGSDHCFCTIGNHQEDPESTFIVDSWPTERDALLFSDSKFSTDKTIKINYAWTIETNGPGIKFIEKRNKFYQDNNIKSEIINCLSTYKEDYSQYFIEDLRYALTLFLEHSLSELQDTQRQLSFARNSSAYNISSFRKKGTPYVGSQKSTLEISPKAQKLNPDENTTTPKLPRRRVVTPRRLVFPLQEVQAN